MSRERGPLPHEALPGVLRRALLGAFVCAAVAAPGPAGSAPPARATATTEITFAGRSTLHDFHGTAPTIEVTLESETAADSIPPSPRWKGALVIPVAGLDTDNGQRDASMREMFEAERWPEIRVALGDIEPEAVRQSGRLPLRLTIRDRTREVEGRIGDWQESPGRVNFVARVPVSLAAFGLEAPTVLGFIRVADEVLIEARVTVVPAP